MPNYVLWWFFWKVEYMVEVEVSLTPGDLYDFNLKHSYSNLAGILSTAVGLVGVAYGIYAKYWILAIVGAILVAYTPLVLLFRSHQTFNLSPAMKKPLKYTFDDTGLTVSQGENSTTFEWKDIVKAVSTGRSIIIYTTRYNATIVPRSQAGEKLPLIIQAISSGLDPRKNRIRN